HFSPKDGNYPVVPPDDAIPPKPRPVSHATQRVDDPCHRKGSTIECENQLLGESLDVTGTPYKLNYRSDRVRGSRASLDIPVTESSLPASLRSVGLDISVAGQSVHQTFPPTPNQVFTFAWD